ncbi:hypothetical protein [Burkholderia cepacia]|uniref:hypothetical protein n=1 Tax=Burkholderia cepacia TaxID=292 RepID=UPI0012D91D8D|nr:hypothetical protein [Burkholderia cepacia]
MEMANTGYYSPDFNYHWQLFFCAEKNDQQLINRSMLPIVRPFNVPYEAWTTREATTEEMMASQQAGKFSMDVNVQLIARIASESDAARYMITQCVDNGLEGHIDRALREDSSFRQWLQAMPNATPFALETYQQAYPPDDFHAVDLAINEHGVALSPGQLLFHGGTIAFPPDGALVTTRPFSSTLCPQVALRSAEWSGKAYEADQVNLYLLRVVSPNTKVFVFDPNGFDKGHEKEVLFASGTKLILRSRYAVREDYQVSIMKDWRTESKIVKAYLCEVDVY